MEDLIDDLAGQTSQNAQREVASITRRIFTSIDRTSSAPVRFTQLAKEIGVRRRKTAETTDHRVLNWQVLCRRPWEAMVEHIAVSQLQVKFLHPGRFQYLLPSSLSTPAQLQIHEQMRRRTTNVTHDRPAQILSLFESHAD